MRQLSSTAIFRVSILGFALLSCFQLAWSQACSPFANYKYPKNACTITIDRVHPGSPLPVQVPAGTTVTIVVTDQHKTEIIKTVTANDAAAVPDIIGNAIKQFSSPLGSLILYAAPARVPHAAAATGIDARQIAMQDRLQDVTTAVTQANLRIACLQTFTVFDDDTHLCTQAPLSDDDFEDAFADTFNQLLSASQSSLPYVELAALDADVAVKCPKPPANPTPDVAPTDPNAANCDGFLSVENQLDAAIKTVSTSQATLAAFGSVLRTVYAQTPTVIPPIKNAANYKATIQVTAQEQIGKTSVPVGTVVITWQQSNWSLSTGVVLSSLANQSFNNSPLFANGVPVTDASGKTLTIVTISKSYPGVISPVFLVNYRIHNYQRAQGKWAFLISGGIGINLATKSADFAAGPSIQYGNFIFGPILHYGRQTNLTNGVKVGDEFGDSPPSLPTNNIYKPGAGISLTYRLPIT